VLGYVKGNIAFPNTERVPLHKCRCRHDQNDCPTTDGACESAVVLAAHCVLYDNLLVWVVYVCNLGSLGCTPAPLYENSYSNARVSATRKQSGSVTCNQTCMNRQAATSATTVTTLAASTEYIRRGLVILAHRTVGISRCACMRKGHAFLYVIQVRCKQGAVVTTMPNIKSAL
jgi:hypothetical protein